MPDLSVQEIDQLIEALRLAGLLGVLQGKPREAQRAVFLEEANRQILIALLVATRGERFQEIIQKEFRIVEPRDARILLTIVALASAEHMPLKGELLITASPASPNATLQYLSVNLRGQIVTETARESHLVTRHDLIAEEIVERASSTTELAEAYDRLLGALVLNVEFGTGRRTAEFKLYLRLINHNTVYGRFRAQIEHARSMYASVLTYCEHDWHYWLQRGSLELEYGELERAENYLHQANNLKRDAPFITRQLANVWFKQSVKTRSFVEAEQLKLQASEQLEPQVVDEDLRDGYPIHILYRGRLSWARAWVSVEDDLRREIQDCVDGLKRGLERFPRDKKIYELLETAKRMLLLLQVEDVVSRNEELDLLDLER